MSTEALRTQLERVVFALSELHRELAHTVPSKILEREAIWKRLDLEGSSFSALCREAHRHLNEIEE